MSNTFVVDSWALLAYLQGEEPAASRVREVIENAQEGTAHLFISIINLGEVYYRVGKVRNAKEAESVLADLRLLPMEILSADDDIVLSAARLKMNYAISYADAFAAVTAIQKNAILLTGDPELIGMKKIVSIEKLVRSK
jgi:predicted nucleic acid-binding protein